MKEKRIITKKALEHAYEIIRLWEEQEDERLKQDAIRIGRGSYQLPHYNQ